MSLAFFCASIFQVRPSGSLLAGAGAAGSVPCLGFSRLVNLLCVQLLDSIAELHSFFELQPPRR